MHTLETAGFGVALEHLQSKLGSHIERRSIAVERHGPEPGEFDPATIRVIVPVGQTSNVFQPDWTEFLPADGEVAAVRGTLGSQPDVVRLGFVHSPHGLIIAQRPRMDGKWRCAG